MPIVRNRVVAIDPGDTSGVVIWNPRAPEDYKAYTLSYDQLMAHMAESRGPLFYTAETIVVEKFLTRPNSHLAREQLAPKLIGAIELRCRISNIKMVVQCSSTVKPMVDKEQVRAHGFIWKSDHELDAFRHLLYFIVTRRL